MTNASSNVLSWARDVLLQKLNRTEKQAGRDRQSGSLALNLSSATRISDAAQRFRKPGEVYVLV